MKSTSTLARPRQRTRKARKGHYIEVDGVPVHYLEGGTKNAGPPLVLFHGYRAGADIWYPHAFPAFAAEFRVIALDLPGYGYSGRLPKHNLAEYAAFMNRFFDALGLHEVYLMGHSMGGQVAVATAAYERDRYLKLVLVDSTGLPRTGTDWRTPFQMMLDASTRHLRLYPPSVRLGLIATAGSEGLTMLRHDFVSSYLKSLTMPTLVVWGSRDRIVPLEHGAFLARVIPSARLAVIHGAGHVPFYQKAEEFNRLVIGFLKQPVKG